MKKNRSALMLRVLVVVVAIGLPYYFSRQRATALDVKTTAIRGQEKAFREKVALGSKIRKDAPSWNNARQLLAAAMPPDIDVQDVISSLQALTDGDTAPDHVKWIQGTPSNVAIPKAAAAEDTVKAPVATKAGAKPVVTTATTVPVGDVDAPIPSGGFDMTINVSGSRAKVLAFITKLQQKPDGKGRTFAVKTFTMSASTATTAAAGSAPTIPVVGFDGNAAVQATISLRVMAFGTPTATSATKTTVVPAGPQATLPEPVPVPVPVSAAPSA